MRQHHLIQPQVPSLRILSAEMPAAAVCGRALGKGCREGLSLHVPDPGTRCTRNLMASCSHGCVLALELLLRAVSLRICGFTQQLCSLPTAAISKSRIVIPNPVKEETFCCPTMHMSLNIDHTCGKANPRCSLGQPAVRGGYRLPGCTASQVTRKLAKTPSVVATCHVGKKGIPLTGLYSSVLHLRLQDGEEAE